jgi:hypothetical protein
MKLRYLVLPALLATIALALPGSARTEDTTVQRLLALQSELGFTLDPNPPVELNIELQDFRALDLSADPFV